MKGSRAGVIGEIRGKRLVWRWMGNVSAGVGGGEGLREGWKGRLVKVRRALSPR